MNKCKMTKSEAAKLSGGPEVMRRKGIELKKKYEENPKQCKGCGVDILYEKRRNDYCGHSCCASKNNIGVRRHGKEPVACLNCKKKTKGSYYKYCSKKCQNEYQYKEYVKRWLNGEELGLTGSKNETSKIIRRYLFEKFNSKCSKCGWGEINKFTGKVPLTIHHKDGDYRNNSPDNVDLNCPNCHALTENFGSRQRNGKGRRRSGDF